MTDVVIVNHKEHHHHCFQQQNRHLEIQYLYQWVSAVLGDSAISCTGSCSEDFSIKAMVRMLAVLYDTQHITLHALQKVDDALALRVLSAAAEACNWPLSVGQRLALIVHRHCVPVSCRDCLSLFYRAPCSSSVSSTQDHDATTVSKQASGFSRLPWGVDPALIPPVFKHVPFANNIHANEAGVVGRTKSAELEKDKQDATTQQQHDQDDDEEECVVHVDAVQSDPSVAALPTASSSSSSSSLTYASVLQSSNQSAIHVIRSLRPRQQKQGHDDPASPLPQQPKQQRKNSNNNAGARRGAGNAQRRVRFTTTQKQSQ